MKKIALIPLAALLATNMVLLSGCIMVARRAAHRLEATVSPPELRISGVAPKAVADQMQAISKSGTRDATAIAMKNGKLIFRVDMGSAGMQTRYKIASATKWMTAALVMSVVDEGKLSLDTPVAKVLPEFSGDKEKITLRMLLAQTSGTGNLRDSHIDISQSPKMTLRESALEVAQRPLAHAPGEVFEYGGPGFQVAGAMVEKVTGKRWSDLFNERIARPLGMTNTEWLHLPAHGTSAADTSNPLLQGGVVTTADDYMRFLTMLANNGRYGDHQVLSREAVDAMETAQTIGLQHGYFPPGAGEGGQYALGNWCEKWTEDKRCTVVSSPGAFGTLPFIDRQSGIYGIFFLEDRLPRVAPKLREARKAILMTQ